MKRSIVEPDQGRIAHEARLLNLLGQSTRLRLLYMLQEGERCACELDPAMPEDQSVISRHLIKMREAGLLEWRKEGVSVFYRIRDPRLFELLRLADELILGSLEESTGSFRG
jgi:ArsR family transcriptional regulator